MRRVAFLAVALPGVALFACNPASSQSSGGAPETTGEHRGVAVAPTSPPAGTGGPAAARARPDGGKVCACSPGDPLCSCL